MNLHNTWPPASAAALLIFLGQLGASSPARASYVMACALSGTVTAAPETKRSYVNDANGREIEKEHTRFKFKVSTAAKNGRADADCASYNGQTIEVTLDGGHAEVKKIKTKDRLKINMMRIDSENSPMRTEFSLGK